VCGRSGAAAKASSLPQNCTGFGQLVQFGQSYGVSIAIISVTYDWRRPCIPNADFLAEKGNNIVDNSRNVATLIMPAIEFGHSVMIGRI
jgi:hypothetical protein